jgi:peptide/nickel transport system permease protein
VRGIATRLTQFVVVLWLVVTFTFFLIRIIPGDPVSILVPLIKDDPRSQELRKHVENDLGLNKPLYQQYFDYLGDVATFDLGEEYGSGKPATDFLKIALPVSIQLMIYAQLLALAVAIPLGVLTAYRAGTKLDRRLNATAFGLLAMPNFVLGILLALVMGVLLGILPVRGYGAGWLDPIFNNRHIDLAKHFKTMILPSITLAVGQIAIYMRLLRSDMIATLQENFVTMARSKGLSDRRILWRHALRPSSITLLTVAGLNVGALIGGAVVVEVIYGLPGMGYYIQLMLQRKQMTVLASLILVLGVGFILVNFAVDVLYRIVDPRIRRGAAR